MLVARRAVDDVVAAVELGEQLRDLLRRVLEVVVDRDDDRAVRRADPGEERVVLSVVPHQVDPADARVRRGELLDPLPARVVAAVVDEHDLVVGAVEHRGDPLDER